MLRTLTTLAIAGSFLLSGCGGGGDGGGGSSSAPAGPPVISGTVAIGAPLAGATIAIVRWDGATINALTDSAGRYSVDMPPVPPGVRPLYMVQTTEAVNGLYPRLYSIAARNSGTVNLTPLTTLLIARLIGERQGSSADLSALRGMPMPSDARLAAVQQDVVAYLQSRNVNASGVTSFISTPFNAAAGDPHDDAIERLSQTFLNGETIEGVEEHMLARNDGPATLMEILALQFDAECEAESGAEPAFPTGSVRVSFGPNGQISLTGTALSYASTLAPGDTVRLRNGPAFEESWQFSLNATGDQLQIFENDKRLTSMVLRRGRSDIRCRPISALDLDRETPSVLAQVRKLRSAITASGITCPGGAVFPGIAEGANTVSISPDGVLRVAAGHVLHLPSLGLSLNAVLVDSGGGVLAARVTQASFLREFGGGRDSLDLALDEAGAIGSANFAQQRDGGPLLRKRCTAAQL